MIGISNDEVFIHAERVSDQTHLERIGHHPRQPEWDLLGQERPFLRHSEQLEERQPQ